VRFVLLDQEGQEGSEAVHRTPEVNAEHPGPVVNCLVDERSGDRHARVVAQHVGSAKPLDCHDRKRVDRPGVGDVRVHRHALDARGAELCRNGFQRVVLDVRGDDPATLRPECEHEGAADAARRPGDNGDPIAEAVHVRTR
jgi:hypothetical protein